MPKQIKKREKKRDPKAEVKALMLKKHKQSIDLLNRVVCTKLAPSSIHGVGLFAIRDIKEGEILELDAIPHQFDLPFSKFDKLKPIVQETILSHFPLVLSGSHFFYPTNHLTAYLNHSDTPNYDAVTYKALRDIKEGEEITEDYRQIQGWETIFPWIKA